MRALMALALTVLPLPAFALSCLPHGITDAYHDAANAKEGYVPVLGRLSFDVDLVPQVDWEQQQKERAVTSIPATFRGTALTQRGSAQDFATDVVLEVRCAGPWCPSPQPGDIIGFLRKTPTSYVLETSACGGFLFGQPNKAAIKQLQDCLAGRTCVSTADR